MVEALGNPVYDRLLQPIVVQNGRIDERGEFRLPANDVLGLGPHPIPDRIERGKLRAALRIGLMLHHRRRPQMVLWSRSSANIPRHTRMVPPSLSRYPHTKVNVDMQQQMPD